MIFRPILVSLLLLASSNFLVRLSVLLLLFFLLLLFRPRGACLLAIESPMWLPSLLLMMFLLLLCFQCFWRPVVAGVPAIAGLSCCCGIPAMLLASLLSIGVLVANVAVVAAALASYQTSGLRLSDWYFFCYRLSDYRLSDIWLRKTIGLSIIGSRKNNRCPALLFLGIVS